MKLTFFIFCFHDIMLCFFFSVIMECRQQVSPQCFCWQDCKNLGPRGQHCLYVSSFPCNQMIWMSVVSFLYHLQNGSSPTLLLPLQLVQICPSAPFKRNLSISPWIYRCSYAGHFTHVQNYNCCPHRSNFLWVTNFPKVKVSCIRQKDKRITHHGSRCKFYGFYGLIRTQSGATN